MVWSGFPPLSRWAARDGRLDKRHGEDACEWKNMTDWELEGYSEETAVSKIGNRSEDLAICRKYLIEHGENEVDHLMMVRGNRGFQTRL
jgi:hypothetical protein